MVRDVTTNARSGFHLIGVLAFMMTLTNFGCESQIEVEKIDAVKTSASATMLKPITAMPGDVVTIAGSGFKSNRQKNFVKITNPSGDEVTAPATVTSDTEATFVMPEGVGLGLTAVVLESNGKLLAGSMPFVANLPGNALDIFIGDAAEICSTKQYIDRNGDTQTGAKNCSGTGGTTPSCTADGVVGCVTTASFKSADMTNVTAGNIKSGVTIAGQAGTVTPAPANCSADGGTGCVATSTFAAALTTALAPKIVTGNTVAGIAGSAVAESHSNCSTDGATGCVTTASFKSANMTNAVAGNIKSGVTIAGVTGQYPSATYTLPDSSGTDLTTATFNAQIKSSATFQYFDSAGARYTATGDTNITAGSIANGVSIFGTSGTYTGTAPNAWDLRVGVTVGGVAGKLKVNCRNRVRSALYNYDGSLALIPNTGVTSGTVIDYWDTIDDYNNNVSGLPTSVVPGWTNNDCGGVEASTGDDNVWKDITTTSLGAASTCGTPADSGRCTRQDKISGLSWSKIQGTSRTWPQAINDCDILNHNGQTDWRLPTQKELMDAYNHGIRSAPHANWITEADIAFNFFWSASSASHATDHAWFVYLDFGDTNYYPKDQPLQVVCVR
jgi:hypothetical protein